MIPIWTGGLGGYEDERLPGGPMDPTTHTGQNQIQKSQRDLEHHIQRLTLLNQALWEVLRDHLGLTDEQLEAKIHEVDMRDGVPDGRMTETAVKCPQCQRVSNSRHYKCLYCGVKFKRPIMG